MEDEDIFAYVIESDVGPVKIGISNKPSRRFREACLNGFPKARRRLCGFWRHPQGATDRAESTSGGTEACRKTEGPA